MNTWLTHPATVHMPLALSVLMPFVFALSWWGISRKFLPHGFGWVLVSLSVIVLLSSAFAFTTGEGSKPFSAADSELLANHEQLAKWFCAIWVLIFALSLLMQFIQRLRHPLLRGTVIVILIFQAVLAVRLGRLGGKIVFGYEKSGQNSPHSTT